MSSQNFVDIDFNDHMTKERINTLLLEKPFRIEFEGVEIKKSVSFNELIKSLHTQSLTEVDYVKYGCDMVEFISEHTDLYEVFEEYESREKSYRFIGISDESHSEILNLINYSDNTFPMICKPAD